MIEDKIRIAVLGDLHGHINLALSILKDCEQFNNFNFDSILQVGDLGYFPDLSNIDKATLRFAEKDYEELGFQDFLQETQISKKLFFDEKTKISSDLVFIAGNHEDIENLRILEFSTNKSPIPVDHYGKILYLPPGEIYEINKGKLKIKIAGLGGVSDKSEGYHFTKMDIRKARSLNKIDILLTHEPHSGAIENRGSQEVKDLLKLIQPDYHFCGHLHKGERLSSFGKTESYLLDQVGFRKRHKLNDKCIGVLKITEINKTFSYLDGDWLKKYKKNNYSL